MGSNTSSLREVAISKESFRLGNNIWNGWELEEQGTNQYDPRNTHIASYQAGTPGIIVNSTPIRIVVDGKEFTVSKEQLEYGWQVKKPLPANLYV